MDLERCRYVVVEGPIGAGKTSFARALASHLRGDCLLEEPEANPFLAKFYEDIPRYAGLLTIWAFAGAVWFFWLGYLCSTTHP